MSGRWGMRQHIPVAAGPLGALPGEHMLAADGTLCQLRRLLSAPASQYVSEEHWVHWVASHALQPLP